MKNIFKRIISDFYSKKIDNIIDRELKIPDGTNKIISIVGPRRSGKSFYLFGLINELIESGVDKKNIVYINFEDERININGSELQVIIDAYLELHDNSNLEKVYFFFDEIQNIQNWEKFIRRIYDDGIKNLFISGSNSKLLSKEIATSLRGRSLSFELLPLSFKEFLRFKKIELDPYKTKDKAKLINLQYEYIKWGGFPEIVNFESETKLMVLQEYFNVMLYNDIIERYKVKDAILLKQFIQHIVQSTTKEFSINKIGNSLKTLGFHFDKNILYDFLEYIDNIYLGKTVAKFDYSFKKQTLKKFYAIDNGFLNALSFSFSDNWGKLLENIIYIDLYRNYGEDIFFLKNGFELDFIINKKEKILYQVCYDLNNDNKDREIKGLILGLEKFSLDKGYIVTFEQEDEIKLEGKTIIVIPLWKYFLS